MKKLAALVLMIAGAVAAFGQTSANPNPSFLLPSKVWRAARKLIDKKPRNFEAYNALALALSRRARETSDVNYSTQAEAALQKSFEISPGNFDGERIRVWLLLGKHEFAQALPEATEAEQENARRRDGLWLPDRCECRARQLQGRGERMPADARSAHRQPAGNNSRGLPA